MSRFLLQLQEANRAAVGLVEGDDTLHVWTNSCCDETIKFLHSLGTVIDPELPRSNLDDDFGEVDRTSRSYDSEEKA